MAEILNLDGQRKRSRVVPQKREVQEAFPHNLPTQPTPFIGREQELSEIKSLLSDPSCRLLTLVGPGGIGKTRLALEAASHRLEDYPNGVWFVPFVGVGSAEHIVPAIAESLGFSFYGVGDPKVQLLNYLREKRLLLVWDNFEHLLPEAGLVSEVLRTAPGVRCLVTSRALLRLREEQAFQVKGLEYPKDEKSVESVDDYSAVKLFLQGAKRSDATFRLGPEERPFVVQVCQGVEGMPLGIELASSWVRALSVKEIAKEVEKSIGFFTTAQKDIPERHRSLKAVFEHSYSLLAPEEQRAFRRMSVFRGGFGREAAEKVAGATLPVIAGLIDKSLIRKSHSGRYEVHELMRQFGDEKLKGRSEEKRKAQDRHAEYYAEFLHEREEALVGAQRCVQKGALEEIGGEIDNIRAGWRFAVERERVKVLEKAITSLRAFYFNRGWAQEGQEAFERAIGKLRGVNRRSRLFGLLLSVQGGFYFQLGNLEKAKGIFHQSIEILRRRGASNDLDITIIDLAGAHIELREYREAKRILQENLERVGNPNHKALNYQLLGETARDLSEFRDAKWFFEESLRMYRKLGDRRLEAWCLCDYSSLARELGLYEESDRMVREGLAMIQEIGDSRGVANALAGSAVQALATGKYSDAKRFSLESLSLFKEVGDQHGTADLLATLGWLEHELAAYDQAKRFFQESIDIYKQIGSQGGIAECLCGMGDVSQALGNYSEAKRLYQESFALAKEKNILWNLTDAKKGLGEVSCSLNDYDESMKYLQEALRMSLKSGRVPQTLSVLTVLAANLAKTGEKEKAFELLSFVLHQPTCTKGTQVKAKKLFFELKAIVPAKVVGMTKKRGEVKSFEDVAEEILGEKVESAGEEKLKVLLLGPPKVLFGDREISEKAWGRRKAKKLFCYLVLNQGKTFPCEVLVEDFWPKLSAKLGLVSLNTTLSTIRKILKAEAGVEGPVVTLDEGQCGLDPKFEVALDVDEFEYLLRKGKQGKDEDQRKATRKALSLVRGTFCEGWYDPWVVEEERRLCEKRLSALREFGSSCLEIGQEEESIGWLEKAVGLDNYHEETFRNLLVAYARTGRKKALKEAFENLKQVLRKELRAEPERETVELYKKLTAKEMNH